jgi:hypothetical protein
MNNQNLIFYSQNCPTCRNLIMILKNENLLSCFNLICVDDKLDKFPQNMRIPTMTVVDLNKPLVAEETFEWVKRIKFMRQNQVMDTNKRIIQTNNNNNNIDTGPVGYDDKLFGGISDTFALTKSDMALPHAYVGANDTDKNVIFTAPQDNVKLNRDDQQKMMKMLGDKRSIQDENIGLLMKQGQINAVMNADNDRYNRINNNH